jgi:sulfotransferase
MPGLHRVRPKVEPIEPTAILPREIFVRFASESFWMDPKNNISQCPSCSPHRYAGSCG